jgi:hypothetical protein
VPTESLRAAKSASVEEVRGDGVLALDGSLEEPLLSDVAVGTGNAVFVKGRCEPPAGRRIGRLTVALGSEEHPLMGFGISDRRMGRAGDMWWGVVPLVPVAEPVEMPLTLRAELDGGGRAEARLATWRLLPGLDREPVPPPAGKGEAAHPLIAVCMATFEPPLDLFARQIESIRSQTHDNWICVVSDDGHLPWPRPRPATSRSPTRTTGGTLTSSRCFSESSSRGRCSPTATRA